MASRATAGQRDLFRPAFLRSIRAFLQKPVAGVVAAVVVILPLVLFRSSEAGPRPAFIGVISAIAALSLTVLDHATIRFMTLSGFRAGRVIGIHARSALIFLMLVVPACLALDSSFTAIVVGVVVVAALILMTVRILVFRVHAKRIADAIASICATAICLAGYAAPMLLPLIVIAVLWHLHRRSAPATWILT